jgi:hypothetical protein
MMVKPYPTFFHPQQPKVSVFITSSLCPTTNKHCSKNQKKKDSTDNHNTQPIYIAQNKLLTSSLKKQKWAKYLGEKTASHGAPTGRFCGVDGREFGRESANSVESTGEKSSESPGGSRPVLWSRQERNLEGVGREGV